MNGRQNSNKDTQRTRGQQQCLAQRDQRDVDNRKNSYMYQEIPKLDSAKWHGVTLEN